MFKKLNFCLSIASYFSLKNKIKNSVWFILVLNTEVIKEIKTLIRLDINIITEKIDAFIDFVCIRKFKVKIINKNKIETAPA